MSADAAASGFSQKSRIAHSAERSSTTPLSSDGTCRNGHPRTPENTALRGNGHRICLECHRITNLAAVQRYQATAAGMLSRIRSHAKERGNR